MRVASANSGPPETPPESFAVVAPFKLRRRPSVVLPPIMQCTLRPARRSAGSHRGQHGRGAGLMAAQPVDTAWAGGPRNQAGVGVAGPGSPGPPSAPAEPEPEPEQRVGRKAILDEARRHADRVGKI